MLLVAPSLFNNSSERTRGRGRRKTELREGESATGCDQVGPPVYDFCITGARCQTFSPWKECLPNQFHVNGLGGNHSPLVRLRVQLLKHAPREKYREDGGQEEANKRDRTELGTSLQPTCPDLLRAQCTVKVRAASQSMTGSKSTE